MVRSFGYHHEEQQNIKIKPKERRFSKEAGRKDSVSPLARKTADNYEGSYDRLWPIPITMTSIFQRKVPLKNVFKLKSKRESQRTSEAVTIETRPSKTDITIAQENSNRRDSDYKIDASYL
jgi:hypothetical protein